MSLAECSADFEELRALNEKIGRQENFISGLKNEYIAFMRCFPMPAWFHSPREDLTYINSSYAIQFGLKAEVCDHCDFTSVFSENACNQWLELDRLCYETGETISYPIDVLLRTTAERVRGRVMLFPLRMDEGDKPIAVGGILHPIEGERHEQ